MANAHESDITPPSDIELEEMIDEVHYWRIGSTTTICTIILHSGFTITETSASLSRAAFDEQMGREIAREKCLDMLRAYECYARARDTLRSE